MMRALTVNAMVASTLLTRVIDFTKSSRNETMSMTPPAKPMRKPSTLSSTSPKR